MSSLNVENLVTKLSEADFVNYIRSFDIFCAIETFTSAVFDFSTHFQDYCVFHSPAIKLSVRGRRSGGVAVLIRKTLLPYMTRIECNCDNTICFKISKDLLGLDKDLLFVSLYVPPYQSPYYKQSDTNCAIHDLENFLFSLYERGENSYLMVVGDLNARIAEWHLMTDADIGDFGVGGVSADENEKRRSQDKCTNQFGKILIDFCTTFQCTPLNGNHSGDHDGQFTFVSHQGNSVIDYVLVSIDFIYKTSMHFEIGSRVESSHMPLHLNIAKKQTQEQKQKLNSTRENTTRIKWNSEKAEEYKEKINSEESKTKLQEAFELLAVNTESALKKFSDTLLWAAECMRRTVWSDTGTRRDTNRWFDRECLAKKRAARRALNRFQRTGLEADKVAYNLKRTEYKSNIFEKKKEYRTTVHQQLFDNKRNSNKFWDIIKKARQRKRNQPEIDISDWESHLKNVLGHTSPDKEQTQTHANPENDTNETFVPELDNPIKEHEVRQAIKNLKTGKACGLDDICGEFLKHADSLVVPFLTNLFNRLYDASHFPVDWCKSVIIPLLKKGDDKNPDNYRGISLLSVVSKVFTAILNKRLYTWAEHEKKISKEQAGFRKGYSTVDHIFTLTSMITKKLNSKRGGKVYVAFVDYKKAFDTVNREALWDVLQKLKTSSKIIRILKAMYNSVKSCVRWGANLSQFFECPQGVKQGCLLSPLIFSLLISEVAEYVRKNGKHGIQLLSSLEEIFLLLFADDIVLVSSTPSGLQTR